jgi:hypothetical protein
VNRIPLYVLAVCLWSGVESASAQTFLEYQHHLEGADSSPTVDGQIMLPGTSVKPFIWFLVSPDFSEALLGVSKDFRPWFGGAIAAGVEAEDELWRANAALWGGKGRFFTLFITETGASGYWYKFTTTARLNSRTNVGVIGQAFFGWGPLVEVGLGKGFQIWGSVTEGPETLLGIRRSF